MGNSPTALNPITLIDRETTDAVYTFKIWVQWVNNKEQDAMRYMAPHRKGSQRPVGLAAMPSCTCPNAIANSLRRASTFQIVSERINPPPLTSNAHVTQVSCPVLCCPSPTARSCCLLPLLDIGIPPGNRHEVTCI